MIKASSDYLGDYTFPRKDPIVPLAGEPGCPLLKNLTQALLN